VREWHPNGALVLLRSAPQSPLSHGIAIGRNDSAQFIQTSRLLRFSVNHPVAIGADHGHVQNGVNKHHRLIGREWPQVVRLDVIRPRSP